MKEGTTGSVVDRRFRLRREIARGGMGIVFEAEHVHTKRTVAVKVLIERNLQIEAAHKRLLREAHALTSVRHPNVVDVLDAGQCAETGPFVVLEMLEGRGLDGILAARPRLPVRDTTILLGQVCDALAFAHARGVVHRYLKPSNIYVARNALGQEQVKLLDFGIAQMDEAEGGKITKHGELLGTLEYMAPEQLLAEKIDHRCDLYSACVTLYECLTGQVPVQGDYSAVVLWSLTGNKPEMPSKHRPEIGGRWDEIISRGLESKRERRFQSAEDLAKTIREAGDNAQGHSTLLGGEGGTGSRADAAKKTTMARRFVRVPYITPVRIVRQDAPPIDGRTEDLSEGGMLVLADQAGADGETVQVRFALPMTGAVVNVQAVTRWIRNARRVRALGLEFQNLADTHRDTIRKYVQLMS